MHKESFRHADAHFPFFWRHAASGEKTPRWQQFGTPPCCRQKKRICRKTQFRFTRRRQILHRNMQSVPRRGGPRLRKRDQRISRIVARGPCRDCSCVPGGARFIKMESPPPRQAQLQLAERLVAGILQPVFRVNSNAELWSRNKLHAHLLFLNGVARAKRRDTTASPEGRRRGKRRYHDTRMNSNAQSALIVSGKSQKQKQRAIFSAHCRTARLRFESGKRRYRRPCTRWNPVPE